MSNINADLECTFAELCAVKKTWIEAAHKASFHANTRVLVDGYDAFIVSTFGPERVFAVYELTTYERKCLVRGYN